jgi:DNA primase
LKIDESGLHALVNKFIRNRIETQEKALPPGSRRYDEAHSHEENARKAAAGDYDDATFTLLFKDELQEREFARVLLEYGSKNDHEGKSIAEYIFGEIIDESLFDNKDIIKLITVYKDAYYSHDLGRQEKSYYIYHADTGISSLAVSLLNFPYYESEHWKKEFSQSTGYQSKLFEKSYEEFMRTITLEKDRSLMNYLKMDADKTQEEIESAVNYFKLRKIKRMLLENQQDLAKPHTAGEFELLHQTHEHLKGLEREITKKTGTVIIR